MKEIYVVSMQRSGTNAILNWLNQSLCQVGNVYCLLDQFNPFAMANFAPTDLGDAKTLIVSVEDSFIAKARHSLREARDSGYLPIGNDPDPTLVVILRDPFNLFASRMRFRQQCQLGNATCDAIQCWNDHATHAMQGNVILYNRWFASAEYRQEKARQLGCDSNEDVVNRVSDRGGGSSFDRLRFNGKANEMKTGERWWRYRNSPDYWKTLSDVDLHRHARTLFPEMYTTILSYLAKASL